jgi:hypothetical protein
MILTCKGFPRPLRCSELHHRYYQQEALSTHWNEHHRCNIELCSIHVFYSLDYSYAALIVRDLTYRTISGSRLGASLTYGALRNASFVGCVEIVYEFETEGWAGLFKMAMTLGPIINTVEPRDEPFQIRTQTIITVV